MSSAVDDLKTPLPRRNTLRPRVDKAKRLSIRTRYLKGEKIKDIAKAEDISIVTIYRNIGPNPKKTERVKESKENISVKIKTPTTGKGEKAKVLLKDDFDVEKFTQEIMVGVYDK